MLVPSPGLLCSMDLSVSQPDFLSDAAGDGVHTSVSNTCFFPANSGPTLVTFAISNGEVIVLLCIYVMNSVTGQQYGKWTKGEKEPSLASWFCSIPATSTGSSLKIIHLPFEGSEAGTTLTCSITAMLEFSQDNVPDTPAISNSAKRPVLTSKYRKGCTNTQFLAHRVISIGLGAIPWVSALLNTLLPQRCLLFGGDENKSTEGKKQHSELKSWCGYEKLTWWQHQGCNECYPKPMTFQSPTVTCLHWLLIWLGLGHVWNTQKKKMIGIRRRMITKKKYK